MTVIGPVTGTAYRFSGVERLLLMDPRDAVAIARSPLFRVEEVLEVLASEGALSKHRGGPDA